MNNDDQSNSGYGMNENGSSEMGASESSTEMGGHEMGASHHAGQREGDDQMCGGCGSDRSEDEMPGLSERTELMDDGEEVQMGDHPVDEDSGMGLPIDDDMGSGGGDMGMGGGDGDGDDESDEPEPPAGRRCATMEVHHRLLAESPEYARAQADLENESLEIERGNRTVERAGVCRIPVVVHVVWRTSTENISDAQINSQIDVLNRDFRKLNSDVSKVPSVWKSLVGDAKMEFFLAKTDPSGNPTTGINRKKTTVTSFSSNNDVKFDSKGGVNAWPRDKYLNIWVCKLSGGLLGYAQFPGGPANTDGVVCTHTGFGTTGTAAHPFNLGRTATHEVGHFFNLRHIWGDDGSGCTGSDQVADTPNQGGSNVGCPTFPKVSCGNGPNGDMFMNYMDYVDDRCMFMFTKGQVARMEAAMNGPRKALCSAASSGSNRASGPVVAWGPNRLDAFVIGTNSAMYHKWWNGSSWGPSVTGYQAMGGQIVGKPVAVAWDSNRLDAFVRGTNMALYHKWWNGSSWGPSVTGYQYMGGRIIEDPEVVSWGPKRLDVFVVGTNSALYHKWWNGSSWGPSVTGYEFMGGGIVGRPRAVAWGPKRLDVFVIGMNSALYHKWWNGSSWGPSVTGYEYMGGRIQGDPEVVSWGPNRLDVFVKGMNSGLYHKWWNGSSWGPSVTGYQYMGGRIKGQPTAVSWGPNRLDLFVVGMDSALYHKAWDGTSWKPSVTGWNNLGGRCIGTPRVVAWGPNRLDVFVIGTNSALYHKWWDGSSWGPSTTGYQYLGGQITEF